MADITAPYIESGGVYPAFNERNAKLNTLITAQFNEHIDPTSVTSTTFVVIEKDTYISVSGTRTYVPDDKTIKFTPTANLTANTEYMVLIVGLENQYASAAAKVGIKDLAGNYMDGNFTWFFTTGAGVGSDPETEALPSGDTGYENATLPPSGVNLITLAGFLEVLSTDPVDYDTNVDVTEDIEIIFNDELAFTQQNVYGPSQYGDANYSTPITFLQNYIEITNMEVLGTTAAAQHALDWTYSYNSASNKLTILPASGSIAASATGSHWYYKGTYTQGEVALGVFEENNEYVVKIKAGLPGLNTNPLASNYQFFFTTTYDPLFTSVTIIRTELGSMITDVPDDTINRLIVKNGRFALSLYPYDVREVGIPWYLVKYVECKTELDLLNSRFLGLGSIGARKVLADLTIDRDNAGRDLVALAGNKIEELKMCVEATEGLLASGGETASPDWAQKSVNDSRNPISDRSWRRLPKTLGPEATARPGLAKSPLSGGWSRNRGFLRRRR